MASGCTLALASCITQGKNYVQWNLSNTDTLGSIKCVLIRGVSSIQGCPLRGVDLPLYMQELAKSLLIGKY